MVDLVPVVGNPFDVGQTPETQDLSAVEGNPFAPKDAGVNQLPIAPAVASPPVPVVPTPELSAVEHNPFEASAAPPPVPAQPQDSYAITRGFIRGALEQNPTLGAEAFEGLSHLAPDFLKGPLDSTSKGLRSLSILKPEDYPLQAKGFFDSLKSGPSDVLTWAGEQLGQGLASTVPPIAAGVVGAGAGVGVGGMIGGPPGAGIGGTVGAIGGAASASYVLNYGDVYKSLKDAGVAPELAARYAGLAAVPMAALDTASVGPIIKRLGGLKTVKEELARSLARRLAEEAAKGAGRESVTETIQQAIQNATVSLAADKPFWSIDNVESLITAGLAGGLVGGTLGGVSGFKSDRVRQRPPTPDEIHRVLNNLPPFDEGPPGAPAAIAYDNSPPISLDAVRHAAVQPSLLGDDSTSIEAKPGANIGRLARLLGPKLYGEPAELPKISVKEMVQNAFDAVKTSWKDQIGGKININMDEMDRTIEVLDNGSGMTPDVLANQFLQIAGTFKEFEGSSGGLGIAKMLFLYGNQDIEVVTMRDGKVAVLKSSGAKLMRALEDETQRPRIEVRRPNADDRNMFPQGHGSFVKVKVPESYRDPSTGQEKNIPFSSSSYGHDVLEHSPLLRPIEVTMGGMKLPIGQAFPANKYTQFANVNFDWGTARIYAQKEADKYAWGKNLHFLSNGLWQFSARLKKNPNDISSDTVPRRFYVDIQPRVKADDPGYPFDLNRQRFTEAANDDFNKVLNYMSLVYQEKDFGQQNLSFGHAKYLYHTGFRVKATPATDVMPQRPKPVSTGRGIQEGDQVSVENGKLIVNGIAVPELTKEQLENAKLDVGKLTVPQDQIKSDQVMLHDNLEVKQSDGSYRLITELAEERWGERFHQFVFELGDVFKELRNAVANAMGYNSLMGEGIGVSFDIEYRGVSIRVPFEGSFINPAVPEYVDTPTKAALGYYGTMIHELAHHQVRNHGADFPAEMQRIMIHTESVRQAFIDRLLTTTEAHFDIVRGLNALQKSKDARPFGNRFEESSSYQARHGNISPDLGRISPSAERGAGISRGPQVSPTGAFKTSRLEELPGYAAPDALGPLTDSDYSTTGEEEGVRIEEARNDPIAQKRMKASARLVTVALGQLARKMGVTEPISLRLLGKRGGEGILGRLHTVFDEFGTPVVYRIELAVDNHATPAELYATAAHEFGHLLKSKFFNSAPNLTKIAIMASFDKWRQANQGNDSLQALLLNRDNYVTAMLNSRRTNFNTKISELTPEKRKYWLSFDEWFAEQTAKWATTSAKPLNVVDRFFSSLGRHLRESYEFFKTKFNMTATAEESVAKWLDSLVTNTDFTGFQIMSALEWSTTGKNKSAMSSEGNPYFPATEQSAATSLPRNLMSRLGATESQMQSGLASAAAADRFNKFYHYMLTMVQVADRNLHIAELQRYRELWQLKQLERGHIIDAATSTLKAWRKLYGPARDAVAGLIDDYMNLNFLSSEERQRGAVRRPTENELLRMVQDNGVTSEGLDVFQKIVQDFDTMLTRYGTVLLEAANKIVDPMEQAQRIQDIAQQISRLRKAPYFPAMRFGDLTLTIRDAAKQVLHFETFESQRKRKAAEHQLRTQLPPGAEIELGVLPKDAAPLLGLPPGLLDSIADKLELSPSQRAALDQLRFEYAPAHSFRHRFQRKNKVPGYSADFMRAYANYFFHGSNYLMNVKYVDALREQVRTVRDSAKVMEDGTKRGQIANFLSDHLSYSLDPKPDFAALRGVAFLWYLGFSPAAATINLTQMAIGSYPFLASKFGDVATVVSMGKAGTKVSTYYRKATLAGMTDRELRAINEGVKEGVITEAMAPELAAVSEGRNLGKGFGGNAAEQMWQRFNEASSWLFEMSEQMNRRITFRAAFALASENPTAAYVSQARQKHQMQYDRLRTAGWSEADASAFVVAKDAVEATQFIYQQYAQPRFMRGKLRSVFVFKTFVQNTLFMLWNYPEAATRSLLVMAALGGIMGVPGADDIRGLVKVLGFKLFGKDWDVEEAARKFALDVVGDKIPPDLLLHGISRRGFGVPAVMSHLGVPFPTIDMSKSVGLGQISPVPVEGLFGVMAARDQARAIAESTQRASGAVFSTGFNMYRALTDAKLDWNDMKRWERAMPRFAASASKAWRSFSEGQERDRAGNPVIRYDVNDPRQMMEVLALGLGYQPLRLTAQWDRRFAEMEAITFWNLKREALLRQLWTARESKEDYARVYDAVRKYNETLPPEARGKAISPETIRRSFAAKARSVRARESGIPRVKADIPIVREIQRLYPEAEVDVRRVK